MRLRIPARLGHYLEEEIDGPVLYLCPLPTGPSTALTGSGALIWLNVLEGEEDVPKAVAGAYGVEVEAVRDEIERFLDYLVASGLLERSHL